MADYIVPLGFGAIGALILMKVSRGCPCKKREGLPHQLYPHHWRNRIGVIEAIPMDQYKDHGEGKITSVVKATPYGPALPAELSRGPTLNPGMLNPADGSRYDLQQVHRLRQQIANHPAPPTRKGYKRRAIKATQLM